MLKVCAIELSDGNNEYAIETQTRSEKLLAFIKLNNKCCMDEAMYTFSNFTLDIIEMSWICLLSDRFQKIVRKSAIKSKSQPQTYIVRYIFV